MIKSPLNNFTSKIDLPNLDTAEKKELKKSCDMYESLYYKKMLEVAYKNIEVMGTGVGSDIYKDMYLDELSKSSNGTLGLSKMLFDHLKEKAGL